MPHRSERRNKILPTKARKRPNVRLCGGGRDRPSRAETSGATGGEVCALRHSFYLAIILDNELDISPIAWLCMPRAKQTEF